MISLLRVLHLLSLLNSVLGSLPAPVNLSVHSVNFHHVLRWDPGPGTPPGTWYNVTRRKNPKGLGVTQGTSLELELSDSNRYYYLSVHAFSNQTQSKKSKKYSFAPYKDTTIGPPEVSLAGCGNCIQVNISLPEPDSRARVFDIQKFLGARFRVLWRKRGEEAEKSDITENRSYTLKNLQVGTEYCVKVETELSLNPNTEPSDWNCTFTSIVEPRRVPVVIGTVAALLLFAVGVLFALMWCLHYAGVICKLKETLPRALIEALSRGYTLTPERTIPDKISIETLGRHHLAPAAPQPPTRGTNSDEEEDEDEEGNNVYVVRDPELSSGESSRQNSGNCGGSTEVEANVLEDEVTPEGLHHHHEEDEAEEAEVPLVSEDQTDAQEYVTGEEEEEEEDVCDSSGDINLFSVTLSALAANEEEEQNTRDSLTDLLKLDTDSTHTLRHTHSQRGSDDETTVALLLPTHEDFTDAGYEDRHEETEEEEEEFSEYMRHT